VARQTGSSAKASAERPSTWTAALVVAIACVSLLRAQAPASLPPWTPGLLDIHQISTGRGNSAFIVLPDGTTMLVDAGPGGDVIAAYITRMRTPTPPRIDYALLTHFHGDHVGGFADVAARIPIGTVIDRGYEYLVPPADDATFSSYRRTVESLRVRGTRVERIRVGRADQIVARRPTGDAEGAAQPSSVEVRNVAANGDVWTGHGDETTHIFPALGSLGRDDIPSENMCSIGVRIRYGAFDYFTGGDMPGVPDAGAPAWQSVEAAVARAIGPTDVHVVNHHGSIDPESELFLTTLRSPVMVLPSWSSTHPSQDVLKRMMAARLYPGPHDIFATLVRPETKASIGPRAAQLKADHGHIVVRVAAGGATYQVFVLDETRESGPVLSVHGPYRAN
jgi:beta-lactamase superfamily II metal-dependent hydrolase